MTLKEQTKTDKELQSKDRICFHKVIINEVK